MVWEKFCFCCPCIATYDWLFCKGPIPVAACVVWLMEGLVVGTPYETDWMARPR
jgi:hypothetical protein